MHWIFFIIAAIFEIGWSLGFKHQPKNVAKLKNGKNHINYSCKGKGRVLQEKVMDKKNNEPQLSEYEKYCRMFPSPAKRGK